MRWAWCCVLFAAAAGHASAQPDASPGASASAACASLVPSPWPATLVERRLHLRRMEGARSQCIGQAGFLAAFGALWLEEGEPEQARVWLERSLMLEPDSRGAQADHALALAALGEPTALNELASAWRARADVPPELRQRIAAAIEPGAAFRLPAARLGEPSARRRQAGRGEASVLVGYESNLAVSPRLSELTLTPPEGPVVLPVISTPRRGAAVKADLSWLTLWDLAPRTMVRSGLSLSARSAPGESSTDWHQVQGALSLTRQWNGWSASAQADAAWFGGALTEPYSLLRTRFIVEQAGESCNHSIQWEADERRQSQTRTADSLTTLLAWRLSCRPPGRVDWQWSLALRGGIDRPRSDERPGGVQRSWGGVLRLEHRPSALTTIAVTLGTVKMADQTGYSPLLADAIRTQTQSFIALEVARALDLNWMPGTEVVLQLTRFRQSSNLALFRHDGVTAYSGLRWPW